MSKVVLRPRDSLRRAPAKTRCKPSRGRDRSRGLPSESMRKSIAPAEDLARRPSETTAELFRSRAPTTGFPANKLQKDSSDLPKASAISAQQRHLAGALKPSHKAVPEPTEPGDPLHLLLCDTNPQPATDLAPRSARCHTDIRAPLRLGRNSFAQTGENNPPRRGRCGFPPNPIRHSYRRRTFVRRPIQRRTLGKRCCEMNDQQGKAEG